MIYIANAFSLNMLDLAVSHELQIAPMTVQEVAEQLADYEVISVVGHADTAAAFSDVLGIDVPMNRASLEVKKGDVLLVGQYKGSRLPEGAKTLPEGASIAWVGVLVL